MFCEMGVSGHTTTIYRMLLPEIDKTIYNIIVYLSFSFYF